VNKILRSFLPFFLLGVVVLSGCRKDIIDKIDPPAVQEVIETQPPRLFPIVANINPKVKGYYVGLPAGYDQTDKKYPAIVWIHGAGQFGNGNSNLALLLREGIPKHFADKSIPPNFKVAGKNFSFILFTPQFVGYPTNDEVKSFVDSVKKKYRVDIARVYMAGMSIGGIITCDVASSHPNEYSAILPMGGVSRPGTDVAGKTKRIATGKLPVWIFHNQDDFVYPVSEPISFVSLINKHSPPVRAKITIFPNGGHDAWARPSDPLYKENNISIYEWMLQYKR